MKRNMKLILAILELLEFHLSDEGNLCPQKSKDLLTRYDESNIA